MRVAQKKIIAPSISLDELTRKQQRDLASVLRVLAAEKGFTVFAATANKDIAKTMDRLLTKSYSTIAPDGTKKDYGPLLNILGGAYPWTNVALTADGLRLLEESA